MNKGTKIKIEGKNNKRSCIHYDMGFELRIPTICFTNGTDVNEPSYYAMVTWAI